MPRRDLHNSSVVAAGAGHQDTLLTMSAITARGYRRHMGPQMTGSMNLQSDEPTFDPIVERAIVIVTFDAAQILDVTGPLEVFSSASRFLPAVRYRTEIVTTRGGPVRASCGL